MDGSFCHPGHKVKMTFSATASLDRLYFWENKSDLS